MSNVVEFKPRVASKPELAVYTCECNSQTWFLLPDGRCICAGCERMTKRLICYDVEPPASA